MGSIIKQELRFLLNQEQKAQYLCNVDELGENLRSQLSGRPAQHHQLNPLGDSVAQGDGTLHHGDVLHAAASNVILVVYKLTERGA